MKILQIQHLPGDFPYNSTAWFARRGDQVRDVQLCRGEAVPDPRSQDAVLVYGGYMSAFDDSGHPWIAQELDYLEACLKADIPVLGICLGSQLLARLLGARVYKSEAPEFGFYSLTATQAGRVHPGTAPLCQGPEGEFLGLEWHNDAWDLPPGASLLASSATWSNQAFSYGPKVLAIQFHLEFVREHMAYAVQTAPEGIPRGPDCEDPGHFIADQAPYNEISRNMALLLEGFLGPSS